MANRVWFQDGNGMSDVNYAVYIDMMASILEADTEEKLMSAVEVVARKSGFERVLVALQWVDTQGETKHKISSGYPDEWQRIYLDRSYMALDPTVSHCQVSTDSLIWTEELFLSTGSRELLEEASHYGVGHGISIPLHEAMGVKSMVSFARDKAIDPTTAEGAQLLSTAAVLANSAQFAYRRLSRTDMAANDLQRSLTPQEKQCLRWVATGKTSWEVGQILSISEATAVFHMKNVMDKLNVRSRAHAITIAFRLGLLQ